jgi:cutinase
LLSTNFNPGGADYAGIAELENLLDDAARRCPNSNIVVGGYRYALAIPLSALKLALLHHF